MTYAYDEIYIESAMTRLGDMLEYACLDCGYDPEAFWKMFISSSVSRRFEVGDVSVVSGKSGPELAFMILYESENRKEYVVPVWREERSDMFWCAWILAYYQWYRNTTFKKIWNQVSVYNILQMYPTLHEADISKTVDELDKLIKPVKKNKVRNLRIVRRLTQKELANRAHMSVSALQRIEYGERKVENLSLKTALALADALGVDVEELD